MPDMSRCKLCKTYFPTTTVVNNCEIHGDEPVMALCAFCLVDFMEATETTQLSFN